MLRILDNPNIEEKEEAELGLQRMKEQYGKRYCPCALRQNEDTLCPCKNFREQEEEGPCHCGRYIKIEVV